MNKILLKKEIWLPIFFLVLVGGLIYAFNLHNGLFWDDDDWIINNVFVHSLSWTNIKFWFGHNTLAGVGLKSNYYRPFLFFTFALNYLVAGVKPLFYHLTSNAIHIFNAVLVFWLIQQSFKRKLLAWLTALFFLVHPLQTEAITYISGRGDALVAMFMLLALLLFHHAEVIYKKNAQEGQIEGRDADSSRRHKQGFTLNWRGVFYKTLSLVFLALGLLSRETAIIFPFLALLFYMAVLSKEKFLASIKQGLIKTWPYFGVVIIYGLLRLTVLNFLNTLNFYSEPNLYSEHLSVRLFTFFPILWQYLKLLLVPVGLHMERGGVVYTSLWQWPVWLIGLILISLLFLLRKLYKKSSAGTDWRIWFFGIFWFFVALAPVSGITPINALMYEHWLYLPMVGFWLIFSYYLTKLFEKIQKTTDQGGGEQFLRKLGDKNYVHRSPKVILIMFLIIYLAFFSYQSIQRNILWGKPVEFYKDILKHEPKSGRISNNLGNLYFNKGDKAQAEIYYRQAVDLDDNFPQPYFNLGSILQAKGDIFGAIKLYEQAIAVNPNFYYPYENLAVIYAQQGKIPKAKENIEKLKMLLPNNPRVFYNSALIYIALNDKKQALADLKEGSKYAYLDPETGQLIIELAQKLQK